jgi:hypothetical protein
MILISQETDVLWAKYQSALIEVEKLKEKIKPIRK